MVDWTTLGIGFIVNLIVGTIILHIAASLVKIDDATIVKAFMVALIAAILSAILGLAGVWGGLVAFILVIAIIKFIYDTSWLKAFITWIVYIIIVIIVGLILGAAGVAIGVI
ncbi:MAG: hypothetical protein HXS46_17905 [Theionarchaea archaeon]|nr:hypothetical protein [Theionarchaea archaeon]